MFHLGYIAAAAAAGFSYDTARDRYPHTRTQGAESDKGINKKGGEETEENRETGVLRLLCTGFSSDSRAHEMLPAISATTLSLLSPPPRPVPLLAVRTRTRAPGIDR